LPWRLRVLELGSRVRFRYSWLIGFNTENYAYSISATELTPGRTAGDPLLGGVYGDEWSYVARVFDPVELTLSGTTCTDEPTPDWEDFDCIRTTFHDLVFSFQGQSARVPVPETASLPTSPQLAVSANSAFVQVTVDQCCFDCEDDLIIASYWALVP
jgi:hypothetical protein